MCEELLPGFFKVNIPLPYSPLKNLNSYIIKNPDRSLVVDTGMNRSECLSEFLKAINHLKIDLDKTDYFITHMHADHAGLLGHLVQPTSRVFFNEPEISIIDPDKRPKRLQMRRNYFLANGYPEKEYQAAAMENMGKVMGLRRKIDFSIVKEGSQIDFGNYCFNCLETPGHSPGHICLYEPEKRILICGDHILNDITPNITWWPELENPLDQYFKSLDKVDALPAGLILTGHRSIGGDYHQRIKDIRQHHQRRLEEVILALREGEKTAFQIAPKLSWDIEYRDWENFPPGQKYFAVGEAIAHIKYLEFKGRIECIIRENKYSYSLK